MSLAIATKTIVRKPLAQNSRFIQLKLAQQFSHLFLIIIDQLASAFRMHPAESLADRPYPTANPVASLDDSHAAAASFELIGGGEPREAGADNQHRCASHSLRLSRRR